MNKVLESCNKEIPHFDGDDFHERLMQLKSAIAKAKGIV